MDKKSKKGEYELDGIPIWTIEDLLRCYHEYY